MLQLQSVLNDDNQVKLSVKQVSSPLDESLEADEVVVKIEAAPINPSDLLVLIPTDPKSVSNAEEKDSCVSYQVPEHVVPFVAGRKNKSTTSGHEGAGVVVKAGSSEEAQRLMGKTVAVMWVRGTYSEYVKCKTSQVLEHQPGTSFEEAASSFVNPMTVVCMIDNARTEGHKAIVHTAAASQLGQMMVRYCAHENYDVVTIVRKQSQEDLLKSIGAKYIVRSDKPTFYQDLLKAIEDTGASCLFDAIGGGEILGQVMTAMEEAFLKKEPQDPFSFYGSSVYKQAYIYGVLDQSKINFSFSYGFKWGINAWLVGHYLAKIGPQRTGELMQIVAKNIKTIFKTTYFKHVSLQEAVEKENFLGYCKQETGKKYLVTPFK